MKTKTIKPQKFKRVVEFNETIGNEIEIYNPWDYIVGSVKLFMESIICIFAFPVFILYYFIMRDIYYERVKQ